MEKSDSTKGWQNTCQIGEKMVSIEEVKESLYNQLKDKEPFKSYAMDQQGEIIIKFIEMVKILRQPLYKENENEC